MNVNVFCCLLLIVILVVEVTTQQMRSLKANVILYILPEHLYYDCITANVILYILPVHLYYDCITAVMIADWSGHNNGLNSFASICDILIVMTMKLLSNITTRKYL